MKIIVAPDSYKGCLSAKEVAGAIGQTLKESFPDADVVTIPLADGGEGTVDNGARPFLCRLDFCGNHRLDLLLKKNDH